MDHDEELRQEIDRLSKTVEKFKSDSLSLLKFHNSQLCTFSVRDARPGFIGDRVGSRFGFPDSSFDSIWSDTPENQAIDNRFSPQRLGRFLYLSRLGQHVFWNIRHHDRFIGYSSTVQI